MNKEFNKSEYNKMCAEFLGKDKKGDDVTWTFPEYLNGKLWVDEHFFDGTDEYCGRRQTSISELKFDSDWNWIMEVVEKINDRENGISVSIHPNSCLITNYGTRGKWNLNTSANLVRVIDAKNRKEAVIQAIWEFLMWFNEQTK